MQEVFEKIIERLEKIGNIQFSDFTKPLITVEDAIKIVNHVAAEYNNGWIRCSEQLPPVETEVLILAKRKFKDEDYTYIRTTAMYEDGTVPESDSCWIWVDIEGEYDEENDCYIVPEGWWENKHYNPNEVYNNVVDDEVIAWQPLPDAEGQVTVKANGAYQSAIEEIEQYREIGTIEECRAAVEELKAAKEDIRKLLSSEYDSSCQFCIQNEDEDAICCNIGGRGSWCYENAMWKSHRLE